MSLQELLKLVKGQYEIVYGEKHFQDAKEIDARVAIASISAMGGIIQIQVEDDPVVPNDLNEPWVKEHIKMYGKEPNVFDGF